MRIEKSPTGGFSFFSEWTQGEQCSGIISRASNRMWWIHPDQKEGPSGRFPTLDKALDYLRGFLDLELDGRRDEFDCTDHRGRTFSGAFFRGDTYNLHGIHISEYAELDGQLQMFETRLGVELYLRTGRFLKIIDSRGNVDTTHDDKDAVPTDKAGGWTEEEETHRTPYVEAQADDQDGDLPTIAWETSETWIPATLARAHESITIEHDNTMSIAGDLAIPESAPLARYTVVGSPSAYGAVYKPADQSDVAYDLSTISIAEVKRTLTDALALQLGNAFTVEVDIRELRVTSKEVIAKGIGIQIDRRE
jgi:hypothetical protein